jgi:hypothetical protein
MSSGGTGGGGIIIIHPNSLKTTGIAVSDLQAMHDALPDGDLKSLLAAYLADLPTG